MAPPEGKKRVAVFGFLHETNTFCPALTTHVDFDEASPSGEILRGEAVLALASTGTAAGGFMSALESKNFEIVPLPWCEAEPGGTVAQNCFETIMSAAETELGAAGPIDAIFAELHGAMVSEAHKDCESEIVRRLQAVAGAACPVFVALDLHGNISPELVDLCEGLSGYRTYPHVDARETGARCAVQLEQYFARQTPQAGIHIPIDFFIPMHQQSTMDEPLSGIYGAMEALEHEYGGDVHLSLFCGFYAADTFWAGPSVIAYGANKGKARAAADDLAGMLQARRSQLTAPMASIDEAVEAARQHDTPGPLVLAEGQDNPGGGSAGDSMALLQALLDADVQGVAASAIHDPAAVAAAHAVGAGETAVLSVGGRSGVSAPLTAEFKVCYRGPGDFFLTGPMGTGLPVNLGQIAVLQCRGLSLLVTSIRVQTLDLGFFEIGMIDPTRQRVLVVKSTVHYRAAFEAMAAQCLTVKTPGLIPMDPRSLDFKALRPGVERLP